ncbi:uncharacterized protein At2g34460, chloroplastic-like [Telopea speciosissima]|uniref:uncharacterized protein At2g34460, chloroplastic-like n=1 Tax=Telopea speciosissima TaxID=54955 RepID=UPI001CC4B066|nr:uncharacterized protein At2g34460, chloroplastic-like [Telopea speciosissima]
MSSAVFLTNTQTHLGQFSLFHQAKALLTKPLSASPLSKSRCSFSIKAAKMEGDEITETGEVNVNEKKKIFVAGATGNTGKRIVDQLLLKGFAVKAGVRDIEKAKTSLSNNPDLQFVKADVTEGQDKLAEAIGNDAEAVICATGFRPSWDLFTPWKVSHKFGIYGLKK